MKVWIDVDNPPQVQYLVPLANGFAAAGHDVVVTARDFSITYDLLRERGVDFVPIGSRFGKSKRAKLQGLLQRTFALLRVVRSDGRPDVLVSASRSSAAAAFCLRIRSYILVDYEFVHLGLYRVLRSQLVFPAAIERAVFRQQGFPDDRLMPFDGLKEDLTFAGIDFDAVPIYAPPSLEGPTTKVLFRPPAEESHYHSEHSTELSGAVLAGLADRPDVTVVFSPRYPWQAEFLAGLAWRNEPVVLEEAVPFLSLLKAADVVVSGGGTMLREAAFVGVPAYSLFQGVTGAVDRRLEELGRLHVVRDPAELAGAELPRRGDLKPLRDGAATVRDLIAAIERDAAGRG